jgi:hypothetical protein
VLTATDKVAVAVSPPRMLVGETARDGEICADATAGSNPKLASSNASHNPRPRCRRRQFPCREAAPDAPSRRDGTDAAVVMSPILIMAAAPVAMLRRGC